MMNMTEEQLNRLLEKTRAIILNGEEVVERCKDECQDYKIIYRYDPNGRFELIVRDRSNGD